MPSSPTDIARLGHRYQVRLYHATTARTLVASRLQRVEPNIRQNTEVYYELGSVDPTGHTSESPEFRITLEENLHNSDLDLLLAGKAANGTSWNLRDYINDSKLSVFILERNNSDVVVGEVEFQSGVLAEVSWNWQMGQPVSARYQIDARLGVRHTQAYVPHSTWGAQHATAPGGINIKDARLFLGSQAAGGRMYRLQSFSLRTTYRTTAVREAGTRAVVGYVVEPPETSLDIELLAADHQPDDILFSGATASPVYSYYDYVNSITLATNAIRVYDPSATEGASVLKAWSIENLVLDSGSPILASVRGTATKRYSFKLVKATTANTGGATVYAGDIA